MPTPTASRPPGQRFDRLSILRNHPFFREIPQDVIERIGSYMTRHTVPRGTILFSKGDRSTGLMAVMAGAVRISVPSADGRDIVLNVIREGEIFGEIALLDGRPRTADATAVSDCELLVIERRDFLPLLRDRPDLSIKFIDVLCSRLRRTSEQVEDVLSLDLPSRLAKTLLRLIADRPGTAQQTVTITQRELSDIIGMTRESTNKQLRAWERQKLVQLGRGSITVLHTDALAELATEEDLA